MNLGLFPHNTNLKDELPVTTVDHIHGFHDLLQHGVTVGGILLAWAPLITQVRVRRCTHLRLRVRLRGLVDVSQNIA